MNLKSEAIKSAKEGEPGKTIYYGWTNLVLAALAMVGTLPGRTQGLGLVTEPLLADLRIGRVAFAKVNLWATLIGAAFCLPCGKLTDRFGSRAVLTGVLLALGVTVLVMSYGTSLPGLWITVTLSRGFGQSALSVVSLALVGKWFARRLNMAMGAYALLVGIGFITAFPIVGQAVLKFGWRIAWFRVGMVLVAILTPLSLLFVRNNPEEHGLQLDGISGTGNTGLKDLTLWQALRSQAFWIFALSSSIFGLVYSGIALFNQSILEQRGFDARTYHVVLVVSTLVGLLANFGGGWLASRWQIRRLMGVGMALLAAAVASLPLVRTYAQVMLYSVAMGMSGGVVTVVFFSVWAQVFGRSQLGRIQGAAQMLTVIASAVGPLLLAEALQRTGSYDRMFYALAIVIVLLGIASWWVALPSREKTAAPVTSGSRVPSL
ncbi:MAG: MFS transporter [Terriglobia bacterium]